MAGKSDFGMEVTSLRETQHVAVLESVAETVAALTDTDASDFPTPLKQCDRSM